MHRKALELFISMGDAIGAARSTTTWAISSEETETKQRHWRLMVKSRDIFLVMILQN